VALDNNPKTVYKTVSDELPVYWPPVVLRSQCQAAVNIDPRDEILSFLESTELFGGLSKAFLIQIADDLKPLRLAAGEPLLREGDVGDSLFLLFSGKLQVLIASRGKTTPVSELEPGAYVGESALLTGDRRSATVVALTDTVLVELSRSVFESFSNNCPHEATQLLDRIAQQTCHRQLASALHRSEWFSNLDPTVLKHLQNELEPLTLASGQILMREGEEADALFLLVSGRLRVTRDDAEGRQTTLGELVSGDVVGETTILDSGKRTATVTAVRDSNLARLSKETLDRILQSYPTIATALVSRKLVRFMREQSSESGIKKTFRTLAVVSASKEFDLEPFCHTLCEVLSTHARVLHLSSARLGAWLSQTNASQLAPTDRYHNRFVDWLNGKEFEYEYVLYQSDPVPSPWTNRCIRQADEILLVADAAGAPEPTLIERAFPQGAGPRAKSLASLVLVHTNSHRPSGTARWLDAMQVSKHYHVRADSRADFARLGRLLTGRGIGLVLGGGFALGIAHLGVIRALRDAQIPIDAIGGTSMGGIIAGFHAIGYDEEKIIEGMRHGGAAFHDWTLPVVSLQKGRKLEKLLDHFRSIQIEDLWLPYFCVATNLTKATLEIFDRGPLLNATLATARVPGVFPPVVFQGDLVVDGGLLNNVPADVMKTFCNGGPVVAVDVSPKIELARMVDYGLELSGWRVLLGRLFHSRHRALTPSLLSILARTVSVKSETEKLRMKVFADLYLRLPLEEFRAGDFRCGAEMVEVAYHYALKALETCDKLRCFH
jgi:predicted acylesterase/phospholipase RssA/CRP-like cAMP-binding protein